MTLSPSNDSKLIIKEYFEKNYSKQEKFIPGKSKIPLAIPPYSWQEVCEALDSMLSMQTTMGKKVKKFEESFAKYIGSKYAIMVNSGSSANLLALSVLSNPSFGSGIIKKGNKIIPPATTWVTTVYPIVSIGAKPVFVDIEMGTYNIDTQKIEKAITKKTKAIMLVHLLGYPCNMTQIKNIAKKHNLLLIEDTCESHGAEFNGKKVGSFGDLSTFSFFASHHITTMEGGMLVTNNPKIYELGKSIRTFGWTRDLKNKKTLEKKYSNIDTRYLFLNMGFNMRPTEIQGAFGIHQIKKLDHLVKRRIENADYFYTKLNSFSDYLLLPPQRKKYKNSFLVFPITVIENKYFNKNQIVDNLEKHGIETRQVVAGNIVQQPVINQFSYRISGDLKNSEYVMKNSFVIGIHDGIDNERRNYISQIIAEFISKKTKS